MRVLRLSVDDIDHGVHAELTFTARSAAVEEPHYWWRVGVRTIFDYTRFTQFGTWSGWIDIDGVRHVDRRRKRRGDHAIGRGASARPGESAPTGAPVAEPQFFWLWAPVNFPSLSTHFDSNEYGDGRRWHEVGAIVRTDGTAPRRCALVDYRVDVASGHAMGAALRVRPHRLARPTAHRASSSLVSSFR